MMMMIAESCETPHKKTIMTLVPVNLLHRWVFDASSAVLGPSAERARVRRQSSLKKQTSTISSWLREASPVEGHSYSSTVTEIYTTHHPKWIAGMGELGMVYQGVEAGAKQAGNKHNSHRSSQTTYFIAKTVD